MAGKEKKSNPPENAPTEGKGEESYEEFLEKPLASAKNIAKPGTALPVFPYKKLSKVTVSYLGDPAGAPDIDDLDKINKASDGETRTPLHTVILALVAKAGGKIQLDDLASQVPKHWNRPLPGAPYTLEEFVYMIVGNSDNLRVS